ncbi:MAG: hypothetical protein Kow006_11240 [Gammaproteobacteria bacterium]
MMTWFRKHWKAVFFLPVLGAGMVPALTHGAGSADGKTTVTLIAGSVSKSYVFDSKCLNVGPVFTFIAKDTDAGVKVAISRSMAGISLDITDGEARWVLSDPSAAAVVARDDNGMKIRGEAGLIVDSALKRKEQIEVELSCG